MADVNYGLALGVKAPEPAQQQFDLGKTLSTYASLQMSQAHANLYSLEAAKQAMTIGGLRDAQSRMAAGQKPEDAVSGLAGVAPELAKSFLEQAKTAQDMRAARAYSLDPSHNPDLLGINPALRQTVREADANVAKIGAETTGKTLENTGKRMGLVAQTAQGMPGLISSLPTSAPQQEDPQIVAARASIAGGVQNNMATGTVQPGQANAAWSHAIDGMLKNGLITPQQAEQWRQEGYSPARIKQLMAQGQTPHDFQVDSGAAKLAEGRAGNTVTAEAQGAGLPGEAERQRLAAVTADAQFRLAHNIPLQEASQTAAGAAGGKLPFVQPTAEAQARGAGAGQNATELAAVVGGITRARAHEIAAGQGAAANETEKAAIEANLPGLKAGQTAAATGAAANATEQAAINAGIPRARAKQIGAGTGEAANETELAAIAANIPGAKAGQVATAEGTAKNATEQAALDAGIPGARARQIGAGTGAAANETEKAAILAHLPGLKAGQVAAAQGVAANATEKAALDAGIPAARAKQIGSGTGEAANATEAAAIAAKLPGARAAQVGDAANATKLSGLAAGIPGAEAAQTAAGGIAGRTSGPVAAAATREQAVLAGFGRQLANVKEGPELDAALSKLLTAGSFGPNAPISQETATRLLPKEGEHVTQAQIKALGQPPAPAAQPAPDGGQAAPVPPPPPGVDLDEYYKTAAKGVADDVNALREKAQGGVEAIQRLTRLKSAISEASDHAFGPVSGSHWFNDYVTSPLGTIGVPKSAELAREHANLQGLYTDAGSAMLKSRYGARVTNLDVTQGMKIVGGTGDVYDRQSALKTIDNNLAEAYDSIWNGIKRHAINAEQVLAKPKTEAEAKALGPGAIWIKDDGSLARNPR